METKFCNKCSDDKPIGDFYTRGAKENNRPQAYCKLCFNAMCIERWRQRKLKAIEKLGRKCQRCRHTYHPNVYDFHHLYGKDYDWTKLRLRSEKTIEAELAKCILLCANCHRLEHTNDTEGVLTPFAFAEPDPEPLLG